VLLAAIALVLAVWSSDGWAGAADWPHVGFDGGRGYHNRLERRLDRANLERLRMDWQRRVRTQRVIYEYQVSPVIVASGRVFAVWNAQEARSLLTALDEETGSRIWTRRFRDWVAPIAATSWTLVVGIAGRRAGTTMSLNARTGETRWSVEDHLPFATDRSMREIFTIERRDGTQRVTALSRTTGEISWSRRVEVREGLGDPLVARGLVLVPARGSRGARIVALHAADGTTAWSLRTRGWPMAADGERLYTIRWRGGRAVAEAIGLRDEAILWSKRFRTQAWIAAVGGGRVFVNLAECARGCEGDAFGEHRGAIVALDARTGRVDWRLPGNAWGEDPLWQAGALANGQLFVYRFALGRALVGALAAASGQLRWSTSWGGRRIFALVDLVANGAAFGGTYGGGAQGGRVFRIALPSTA